MSTHDEINELLEKTKNIVAAFYGDIDEAKREAKETERDLQFQEEDNGYDDYDFDYDKTSHEIKDNLGKQAKRVLMRLSELWGQDLPLKADDSPLPEEPSKVYMLCRGSPGDAFDGPTDQAPPCLFYGFYSTRELAQAQANTFNYEVNPVGVLLDAPARRKPVTVGKLGYSGTRSHNPLKLLLSMMGLKDSHDE